MKKFTKSQINMLLDAAEKELRNHSPMNSYTTDKLRGKRGYHNYNTFNAIRHLLIRVEYDPLIQTFGIKHSPEALAEMAERGFLEKVAEGKYRIKEEWRKS